MHQTSAPRRALSMYSVGHTHTYSEGGVTTQLGGNEVSNKQAAVGAVSAEDVQCPICVEPLRDAFVTSCGHTFCYPCISTHLKHRRNCPSCSSYLTTEHIYPNFMLNKIVSKAASAAPLWASSLVRTVEQVLQASGPQVSGRELDQAIHALQSARNQLVQQEATSGLQLLLLLLQDARQRKQAAAAELKSQLEVLERDMTSVAQQQHLQHLQKQAGAGSQSVSYGGTQVMVSSMPTDVGELSQRLQAAAATALAGGASLHVHKLNNGLLSSVSIQREQLHRLNMDQLAALVRAGSAAAAGSEGPGQSTLPSARTAIQGADPGVGTASGMGLKRPPLALRLPKPGGEASPGEADTPTSVSVRAHLDCHISNHLSHSTSVRGANANAAGRGAWVPVHGAGVSAATQPTSEVVQVDVVMEPQPSGTSAQATTSAAQQPATVATQQPITATLLPLQSSDSPAADTVVATPARPAADTITTEALPQGAGTRPPVPSAAALTTAATSAFEGLPGTARPSAAAGTSRAAPAQRPQRTSSRSILGSRTASQAGGAADEDPSITALRAAKKRQILTQFEDLQRCYLTLRTRDTFQQVLRGATTFSRMVQVAEVPRAAQGGPMSATARNSNPRPPSSGRAASTNFVSCIDFDVTEKVFASCSPQRVCLWNYAGVLTTTADQQVAAGQINSRTKLTGLAFGRHQAELLACSDSEGQVVLYDSSTLQMVLDVEAHDSRVWALDFAPGTAEVAAAGQAHCLASGSDDYTVRVWDTRDGKPSTTIDTRANVCSVRYNPWDGHYLAVGSAAHAALVYDLRKAGGATPPLATLAGHSKAVSYVRWAARGELVSASTDSSLRLWELPGLVATGGTGLAGGPSGGPAIGVASGSTGGECVRTYTGHTNERNFVGLSVDNDLIAAGSETNEVVLYYKPLCSPGIRHALPSQSGPAKGGQAFISSLVWRSTDKHLVVASSQGSVWALSLQ